MYVAGVVSRQFAAGTILQVELVIQRVYSVQSEWIYRNLRSLVMVKLISITDATTASSTINILFSLHVTLSSLFFFFNTFCEVKMTFDILFFQV